MQPVLPNPCDGNQCDQLCLLPPAGPGASKKYKGFVCKCRPGFRLVDGWRCVEKASVININGQYEFRGLSFGLSLT